MKNVFELGSNFTRKENIYLDNMVSIIDPFTFELNLFLALSTRQNLEIFILAS